MKEEKQKINLLQFFSNRNNNGKGKKCNSETKFSNLNQLTKKILHGYIF